MKNETIERDYDKNPIIINDYNYIFWFLFQLWFIPIIVYALFYNPGEVSKIGLYTSIFIVMPILFAPTLKVYFYAKGKRKIKFLNNEIQFLHENSIITSIKVSEIISIKKSYTDCYHKSQEGDSIQKNFSIIIFPIVILSHILLIINKYLLIQLLNGTEEKYRLQSAILVFSKSTFINIFPTTQKDYLEIRSYLMNKISIDIEKEESVQKYVHYLEKIDL